MRRDLWLLLGGAALIALFASNKDAVVSAVTDVFVSWKDKAGDYLTLLNAAEDRYGIPRDLLVRQAYEESHFRPDIISGATVSAAGALGIMQIVPKFHPTADPLNVTAAIDYAAGFLSTLHEQFGSWSLALAAYNAGPGNVHKYGNTVPPFAETQKYVADIIGDVNALPGGGPIVV